MEIITWKQLALYLNPIVILNINRYFDPLLEMLHKAVEENFMREKHAEMWSVTDSPAEAVRLIQTLPVWDTSIRRFAAI